MAKRQRAAWMWAAWAFAAGGCGALVGLEDGYYLQQGGDGRGPAGNGGAGGGEASGGGAGAGEAAGGGGEVCTPGGAECVGQTCVEGKCTGECASGDVRCSGNRPQRCNKRGAWEDAEECVGQTCVEGKCTGACGPSESRCVENRPQRCNERGAWEDAEPCPAEAPVCSGGTCITPPSCVGLAATCGPEGNESCCASAEPVPAGTFNRGNDAENPATVSGFLLDRFEVTVGRFRRFVEAYPGSKPAAGAGRHPRIEGSGWDPSWDGNLPADAAALKAAVKCSPTYQTWTDEAGENEHLPMNCLSWYVAFAFCAWDGGRLPTEAEWNYAAAGGDEQRVYPWSKPADSTTIDASYAVYDCTADGSASSSCDLSDIRPVGSRSPKGDGRWGQADLAGNLWEWILDGYAAYSGSCNDCANLVDTSARMLRGGCYFNEASYLLSSVRNNNDPLRRHDGVGVRCARTP